LENMDVDGTVANIVMNLKEIWCEGVDWIKLAKGRTHKWRGIS